jgi:hypothetical protein
VGSAKPRTRRCSAMSRHGEPQLDRRAVLGQTGVGVLSLGAREAD